MSDFAGLELAVDKPQRLIVLHPQNRQPIRDRDGNEAFIELHSADSPIARRHQREIQRRRLNMRGRGKITPEELEAEATDLLVALTVSWRLIAPDGSPIDLPFSPENARKLYEAPSVAWLREQVDEFAADRGNFMPPSSTS